MSWLIDKSALWKLPHSPDYDAWLDRINRGLIHVCLPTRLEVAVSARNPSHWPVLRAQLLDPLLDAAASPRSEAVALQIMESLLRAGLHRAVALPDVLVASIAAVEQMTVLHDGRDYGRIADCYDAPRHERLTL